jgi:hypothetical protein
LELNPLSIKESLEYSKPTMIFNLPTYKGKYDNEDNIIYLTGDTIKDSINLLKILSIKIEKVKETIVFQKEGYSVLDYLEK